MASIEGETQLTCEEDEEPSKNILEDMRKKKEFTDFVLVCDGGELDAHRVILSSQSPYFRKMLLSQFKESSTNQVDFSYVKKDVMLTILDFIYFQRVTIEANENIENLIKIYKLSHLFEINELSRHCMKLILKNINIDDWLNISETVLLHGNDEDVSKIIDFISENLSEIVEKHFFLLTYSQMNRLLEQINENKIPMEEDFLEAIIEWCQNTNQPKAHLQEIFLQINFDFISREFMTDLLEKQNDLLEDTSFEQFFKLQFLPTLKTNSKLYSRFPLKLFFFRRYRIDKGRSFEFKHRLEIFDCEKNSFCKIIDNLPFTFGNRITSIQRRIPYIYILGAIPQDTSFGSSSLSFLLYDWKNNQIFIQPSLMNEYSDDSLTWVTENNIYVINEKFIQYSSLIKKKWFGTKNIYLLAMVATATVKDVTYLLCRSSALSLSGGSDLLSVPLISSNHRDYYCLYTVNKLDLAFHSATPIPKSEKIDRNHVTVYKDKMFVLLPNYEWHIYNPETGLWNVRKTSIPHDLVLKNSVCFTYKFLMFYNDGDLYRFHSNNRDIKKIMTVAGSRDEGKHFVTLGSTDYEHLLILK